MLRLLNLPSGEGADIIELSGEEAKKALLDPNRSGLFWVDITSQTKGEIDLLAQSFKFHQLALEDCLNLNQRPKIEEYSGASPYLFLVTHSSVTLPSMPEGLPNDESSVVMPRHVLARGRKRSVALQFQEMHAFLGQTFLVTVHDEPTLAVEELFYRVRRDATLLARGPDSIYYQLVDKLTDANFPVLESLGDLLENLEEAILNPKNPPNNEDLRCIISLRRALVEMRRRLSPQRDLMGGLSRQGLANHCVTPRTAPYFRDVYDHLTRINESIEAGRDLLASCIDAYHSTVGQRTNDTMKQLTILSSILLPMTFVTGFFGMNFESMPFKSSAFFWIAMILMFVGMPAGIYIGFRRRKWIG